MKSASENPRTLDIPPVNASLNPSSVLSFMSRVKKKLAALAVLLSLEFVSLSLLTAGTFSWTNRATPATVDSDAGVVKLGSPVKTDDGVVLESYGGQKFFIVPENSGIFIRRLVVGPLFFWITLAPKVSRYISISVLNL
jgi:hypothetical protein